MMEMNTNLNVVNTKLEPAKLSVLAETSKVIAYFFHMRNFKYLPEDIKVAFSDQKTLLRAAKEDKDFDDENIELIRKVGNAWDETKDKYYSETALQQFNERNVTYFKDY